MLKNRTHPKELMPRKTKQHISLTIDAGLLEWIDSQISDFTFQSRSHCVEQAVHKLKKDMEKAKEG
jgi:metal-responsive CopG/Arc/MetJ family transcriptional regulator